MAQSLTVSWDWQPVGQISVSDGMIVFPEIPTVAGIYRFTFLDASGGRTGVYVGEADQLRRRFQHYRTPGPSQTTNLRMNPLMIETVAQSGRVNVEIITQAHVRAGDDTVQELDLTWKTARILVERAAELVERNAGATVLNR